MSPSVSDESWLTIDDWWGSFKRNRPLILEPPHIRELETTQMEWRWGEIDNLWETFEGDHEIIFTGEQTRALDNHWKEAAWGEVDDFWDSYIQEQWTEIAELQVLLSSLDDVWSDGASSFNDDPLAANSRPEGRFEGPLRPSADEEDWSQWLAHLLRTSNGAFVRDFLGSPNRPPDSVRREVVFFDEESNRRVDILVEYEETAVSIEVKKGDKHYGKTPHTAYLTERHDPRTWSHILLLQKDNLPWLRYSFDGRLDDTEEHNLTIRSEQYPDIEVRYWQDVSRSLRRILVNGGEPDSHWEASAYLFITLIEQRLLGFRSQPFPGPNPATNASNTVTGDTGSESGKTADTPGSEAFASKTELLPLVTSDPAAQIEYLQSVLREDYDHE